MGKARDRLIRQLGGTPLSEFNLSESELIEIAWETYFRRGELPPALRRLLESPDETPAGKKPDLHK